MLQSVNGLSLQHVTAKEAQRRIARADRPVTVVFVPPIEVVRTVADAKEAARVRAKRWPRVPGRAEAVGGGACKSVQERSVGGGSDDGRRCMWHEGARREHARARTWRTLSAVLARGHQTCGCGLRTQATIPRESAATFERTFTEARLGIVLEEDTAAAQPGRTCVTRVKATIRHSPGDRALLPIGAAFVAINGKSVEFRSCKQVRVRARSVACVCAPCRVRAPRVACAAARARRICAPRTLGPAAHCAHVPPRSGR